MRREYDNSGRSARSRQTTESILVQAERLLRERMLADITLNDVAEASGVSVQTVIRKFGGRDGLLEATARRVGQRIREHRGAARPGDVEGAIDNLLDHYEAEGDLVLRLLAQQNTSSFAQHAASQGRDFHEAWVLETFGPLFADGPTSTQLDALLVATDLSTWSLLRRDHARELEEVRQVMLEMIRNTSSE